MSHKVHPYSHRLGILRDWQSRWFGANRAQYTAFLRADVLLREFLAKRLRGFYVAAIEIERQGSSTRFIIRSSRPGMIIGRSGEGSTKLKNEIIKFLAKRRISPPVNFKLDIEEVKRPEANARIMAQTVTEALEKRLPFKKILRQTLDKITSNREVEGARITLAGRLDGGEMGRVETVRRGRLPLQTLRADVDFAREIAQLPYGVIGVKVWVARKTVA